ncbi:hypothetical protein, partial [Salmonella enterica]|uniref:hypothetical protein n=1 Tax=Salmonella enterica TaxID=28901 RepID=UPI001BAEA18E
TNVSETTQSEEAKETSSDATEPSQEELNAEMKAEATKIDFVTANAGEYGEQDRLYAEGEVSSLTKDTMDTFILTTEEGEGSGMY